MLKHSKIIFHVVKFRENNGAWDFSFQTALSSTQEAGPDPKGSLLGPRSSAFSVPQDVPTQTTTYDLIRIPNWSVDAKPLTPTFQLNLCTFQLNVWHIYMSKEHTKLILLDIRNNATFDIKNILKVQINIF